MLPIFSDAFPPSVARSWGRCSTCVVLSCISACISAPGSVVAKSADDIWLRLLSPINPLLVLVVVPVVLVVPVVVVPVVLVVVPVVPVLVV